MPRRLPRVRLWTEAATRETWFAAVARHAAVGAALGTSVLVCLAWLHYLDLRRGVWGPAWWHDYLAIGAFAFAVYFIPSALSAVCLWGVLRRFGRKRTARARRLLPRLFSGVLAAPRKPALPAIWTANIVLFLGCLASYMAIAQEMGRMAEEAVTLPFAAHGQEGPPRRPFVTVNVTKAKGGDKEVRCVILKKYYSPAQLHKHLAVLTFRHPDPSSANGETCLSVNIRADAYVEFGHVQRILDTCRRAGIRRVSFGVAPEVRKGSGA